MFDIFQLPKFKLISISDTYSMNYLFEDSTNFAIHSKNNQIFNNSIEKGQNFFYW